MKLPEIFKNKLEGNINNNIQTFISKAEDKSNDKDILKELPVKVKIITNTGKEINDTIVGNTKNYIITKSRNVIYIKDIKAIVKV